MIDMRVLADRIESRCIRRGEFTLASGKSANYYYDGKAGMLAADIKVELARALWENVKDLEFEAVGGQALGAVPLAEHMSVAAYYDRNQLVDTFYVREKPKDHGLRTNFFSAMKEDGVTSSVVAGTKVLLLDDVVSTGGSLQIAIDAINEIGAEIVGIAVIVDRGDPDADHLRNNYDFRPLFDADEQGHLHPTRSHVTA